MHTHLGERRRMMTCLEILLTGNNFFILYIRSTCYRTAVIYRGVSQCRSICILGYVMRPGFYSYEMNKIITVESNLQSFLLAFRSLLLFCFVVTPPSLCAGCAGGCLQNSGLGIALLDFDLAVWFCASAGGFAPSRSHDDWFADSPNPPVAGRVASLAFLQKRRSEHARPSCPKHIYTRSLQPFYFCILYLAYITGKPLTAF